MKYNENILFKDFENILLDKNLNLELLNNSNVLITGATGLIGSLLVKFFMYINKKEKRKIKIIALVRNSNKAKKIFVDQQDNTLLSIVENDILNTINLKIDIDYIIHCASITDSKTMRYHPKETLLTSFIGTKNILDLAVKNKIKSFVYISSMEVYGTINSSKKITECDLGYIDILAPRSCYSEGKRVCENLCISYMVENEIPIRIARLSQVFGAGVSKNDSRVFAYFANKVINKENLVLFTNGESIGNYCYSSEAISGILYILLKGEIGEAYTVCNEENSISIKEMAEMVIQHFSNNNLSVEIKSNKNISESFAPSTKIYLSSNKLQSLGWNASINIKDMYRKLFEYWNINLDLGEEIY